MSDAQKNLQAVIAETDQDRALAAAFNAYGQRDFATFKDLVAADRLNEDRLGKLLVHVCQYPPSAVARPASALAVLFESALTRIPRADVVARREGLRAANSNVEASIAVDAILATGRTLDRADIAQARIFAQKTSAWAAKALP